LRKEKPSQEKCMKELKFRRKFSKSIGNKASVITVPRAIAQAWEQYQSVDLVFDGNCLVIKPTVGDGA
jgi:hypothetical protein